MALSVKPNTHATRRSQPKGLAVPFACGQTGLAHLLVLDVDDLHLDDAAGRAGGLDLVALLVGQQRGAHRGLVGDLTGMAVGLGGDTDTLGAIVGAPAGAYYGVPSDVKQKADSFLSEDLREALDAFEACFSV